MTDPSHLAFLLRLRGLIDELVALEAEFSALLDPEPVPDDPEPVAADEDPEPVPFCGEPTS